MSLWASEFTSRASSLLLRSGSLTYLIVSRCHILGNQPAVRDANRIQLELLDGLLSHKRAPVKVQQARRPLFLRGKTRQLHLFKYLWGWQRWGDIVDEAGGCGRLCQAASGHAGWTKLTLYISAVATSTLTTWANASFGKKRNSQEGSGQNSSKRPCSDEEPEPWRTKGQFGGGICQESGTNGQLENWCLASECPVLEWGISYTTVACFWKKKIKTPVGKAQMGRKNLHWPEKGQSRMWPVLKWRAQNWQKLWWCVEIGNAPTEWGKHFTTGLDSEWGKHFATGLDSYHSKKNAPWKQVRGTSLQHKQSRWTSEN